MKKEDIQNLLDIIGISKEELKNVLRGFEAVLDENAHLHNVLDELCILRKLVLRNDEDSRAAQSKMNEILDRMNNGC